jgi:hypothetical protein
MKDLLSSSQDSSTEHYTEPGDSNPHKHPPTPQEGKGTGTEDWIWEPEDISNVNEMMKKVHTYTF